MGIFTNWFKSLDKYKTESPIMIGAPSRPGGDTIIEMVIIDNIIYALVLHPNGAGTVTTYTNNDKMRITNKADIDVLRIIKRWCANPYFADMNLDVFTKKMLGS